MCDAVTLHSGGGKIYIYIYMYVYMCVCVYEGDSKSKGKIHLTAVIQVTVSNFTYYFST